MVHIVSWNVASWPTALSLITERHGSLDAFLASHRIDILALQEVKMQTAVIESALVPRPASAASREPMPLNPKGFESFWAPARAQNTGSKSTSKGFNGVATLAGSGWTAKAERDPLQVPKLDAEGRCVLTYHGSFAIFNVYIPYSGMGSERLPFKVRFLRALRRRMQAVRAEGYAVLLLGDLNIQRRLVDVHPDSRRVDVTKVLSDATAAAAAAAPAPLVDDTDGSEFLAAAAAAAPASLADGAERSEYLAAAAQLQQHWPAVQALLQSRVAEPAQIRTSGNGRTVDRWRLFATPPGGGSRVQLGSPFGSKDEAMGEVGSAYRVDEKCVTDEETREVFVARPANSMRADQLQECLTKACNVVWSPQRLAAVVAAAGSASSAAVCREWLNSIIQEDGMVDSFAELEPTAQGRYTCWSQYLNERYNDNAGSRIDYCLADRGFFDAHIVRPSADVLYNPTPPPETPGHKATDSAECAAQAATAAGLWQQAGYDGSGIPDGGKVAYDSQFREPHTGMIYTPPAFSDHIAVSLLLSDQTLRPPGVKQAARDQATMLSTPYRKQRRMDSFFAASKPKASDAVPSSASSSSSSSGAAAAAATSGGAAPAKSRGLDRWVSKGRCETKTKAGGAPTGAASNTNGNGAATRRKRDESDTGGGAVGQDSQTAPAKRKQTQAATTSSQGRGNGNGNSRSGKASRNQGSITAFFKKS